MEMPPVPCGYRFRPTEQELLEFYLPRMLKGDLPVPCPIPLVTLLDYPAQDLPGLSPMPNHEAQWLFFSQAQPADRKARKVLRTIRGGLGFWKATGVDKDVWSRKRTPKLLGKRRSLVYYSVNEKTNWVLHEFRLAKEQDPSLLRPGDWVVCKLFIKGDVEDWNDVQPPRQGTSNPLRQPEAESGPPEEGMHPMHGDTERSLPALPVKCPPQFADTTSLNDPLGQLPAEPSSREGRAQNGSDPSPSGLVEDDSQVLEPWPFDLDYNFFADVDVEAFETAGQIATCMLDGESWAQLL